jgi:uncharacterized protein (TIGR03067 family)
MKANDLKKLQGTWNIAALEVEGKEMGAGTFAGAQIVIEGDNFSTNAMGSEYVGKMTLDEAKKPNTFDVNFTEGPHKGQASLGVYELDGDTWKICLGFAGVSRPKGFATKPGSGHAMEILHRAKAGDSKKAPKGASAKGSANKDADATVGTGPATELEGEWEMVECIREGVPVEKEHVKYGKRIVRGNLITVTMAGQVMLKATFTMNASANPKTMEYVIAQGSQQGQKQLGIYEWDGKNQKVSFGAVGKERPSDYDVKLGDGRTYTLWKFLKK